MEKKTVSDLARWLEDTADELNDLASMDTMEMYRHLTGLGEELGSFGEPEKTPANFVHGCTSNVYIGHRLENGLMQFTGSSEALIVRGYVAILVEGLSGLSPRQIVEETATLIDNFANVTNIRATLTPSRANAFGNIYRLMVEKAKSLVV